MRTSRLTGLLALLLALSACAAPAATPGATPTVGQPGGGTFSPVPSASGDPGALADAERRPDAIAGDRDDLHGQAR